MSASPPQPLLAERLAGSELFAGLTAPQLVDVAACARVRQLEKGDTIFAQGTVAERAHVVLEGRVRILQTDQEGAQVVMRFVGPGETFGTVGIFTDHLYPAHAVTVIDCLEASWTETAMRELLARYPVIALNLVKIIGARLHEAQHRVRELATQRVERRIAHALLRLAAQAGQETGGGGTAIDFPLSRKDLAEICGATLHTVSRTLTAWEKSGAITTHQQRVTIRDLQEIRRRADQTSP